jgi:lipopolysaccharide/colanic/teichoic acid biosynthesis glycosyltransferase
MSNINFFSKRLFDFTASLVGLLILWPVFLVIAFLIKIKMPGGPVIFKQERVGQHGKLFTMYKFRSMLVDHAGSSISVKGESRITPLGEQLRRYKLDELPELWNVLIGDMSFVGPRPDVPGYADRLQGDDRRILLLKPGITGPASLKYRNEEELLAQQEDPVKYNDQVVFPDKVKINLKYLENRTFWGDIKIIFETLFGKKIIL